MGLVGSTIIFKEEEQIDVETVATHIQFTASKMTTTVAEHLITTMHANECKQPMNNIVMIH
jgi:hypothetical protein